MACGENGVTRLLLTKIPHYKEIILMSFHCEHCGFKNNEIQSGGVIQEKGVRITVSVANERDLSRQVLAFTSFQCVMMVAFRWCALTLQTNFVRTVRKSRPCAANGRLRLRG